MAAVTLSVGQSVTAGSTTDLATILNTGSFEATGSLTGAQSSQVKTGDSAVVAVDGQSGTLTGTVTRIGPADTSGSSSSYPVVVALPAGSHGISAGSTAQIRIVVAQASDTLVVPTSAVNTSSTDHSYVLVMTSERETHEKVSIGVVGAVYTQITLGISKGTTVVLADLSQSIPSSNASTTTGFGGGGFGGGGARRGTAGRRLRRVGAGPLRRRAQGSPGGRIAVAHARRSDHFKIFTARAMTSPRISNELVAWMAIANLAHSASGITSVGLKAVEFVKPRYK